MSTYTEGLSIENLLDLFAATTVSGPAESAEHYRLRILLLAKPEAPGPARPKPAKRVRAPNSPLVFEVGKVYETRSGQTVGPLLANENSIAYPLRCNGRSWTLTGREYAGQTNEGDLVRECES